MRVLALGAHLDDVELGAGATLAKFVRLGYDIAYIGLSWCDNKDLSTECQQAIQILGFSDLNIYNFPVRRFNEHRQEILDIFVTINKTLNPDLVFTHSSFDSHQDHRVIYEESIRAFRNSQLLGYDMPWNGDGRLTCPSAISDGDLDKKITAIQMYASQKDKEMMDPLIIRSLAIVRGMQFKCGLAEAFQTIRTQI